VHHRGQSSRSRNRDASATTTTAADPAASSDATNSRRSIKEANNEPVAREAEPQFVQPVGMPSDQTSAPIHFGKELPAGTRRSEPLKRTSGPLLPREPSPAPAPVRTSGPTEPHEPAPLASTVQHKRGPILPRRLGFSGAALASLARRSNDH
jgi:neural Wiskott-Aldrich syndrome protein